MDENRLVELAATGDSVALTMVLQRARGPLLGSIVIRIPPDLRGEIDPDDIVQDALVSACRRIRELRIRTRRGFNRWLGTIALHMLRDLIRKQRAFKRGGSNVELKALKGQGPVDDSLVQLLDLIADSGHTPSHYAARFESIKAIQAGLDRIPERYQHAIRLVYLSGQPIATAAEKLGKTDRAIHGLLRRGLKLLRQQMGASTDFLSSG